MPIIIKGSHFYYRLIEAKVKYYNLRYTDEEFIKYMYRKSFKMEMDLKNPLTFNEKMSLFKIKWNDSTGSSCADKVSLIDFITKKGCEKYLNIVHGIYSNYKQINFKEIPNKFALKSSHASGWNFICHDKSKIVHKQLKASIAFWNRNNYYLFWRELIYKDMPKRILCENYLGNNQNQEPDDYKIWCFHGAPLYIEVDSNRSIEHQQEIFDIEWNNMPFKTRYPLLSKKPEKPIQLKEMLELAAHLSDGFCFVRVDLYLVNNKIYVGEMTFFPRAGCKYFGSYEYDLMVGSYLSINSEINILQKTNK
ncbi:MAG: hypothetical protein HKK67_11260 [Chlorobiaceae bacterium]|nr:hypothetical protein [Chlorobiaceae bacterium]